MTTVQDQHVAKPVPVRRVRWPVVVILVLTALGVVYCQFFLELNRGYQFWGAVGSVVLGAAALVIWTACCSHLSRRTRLICCLLPLVLAVGCFATLGISEWDGDSIPLTVGPRPWLARLIGNVDARPEPAPDDARIDLHASPDDYPQFQGQNRDGIVRGIKLARDWKARPPREVWRRAVGYGWSGFAVVGDYAFTQELRDGKEVVACYELRTGQPIWLHEDEDGYESGGPDGRGPRATPTVAGGRVYTMSGVGRVNCLDATTGDRIWSRQILKDYDAQNCNWGKADSPLVLDHAVIVTGGGVAGPSLIALDKDTGKTLWTASWGTDDKGQEKLGTIKDSYASPMIATLHGVAQLLILEDVGVAAYDPKTGRQLWRHDWPWHGGWGHPKVSQPLVLPGERIFVSANYTSGCFLLQVSRDEGGQFQTQELWKSDTALKTKFSNAVPRGEYLYGLHERLLRCIKHADGEVVWTARKRYGHGQVLLVDDLLLVQLERPGDIALVEATPEEFRELGRIPALARTTWNTMALAGNLLLVRNDRQAVCFELPLE
jgi:outer membrane protein assembly factor BamB